MMKFKPLQPKFPETYCNCPETFIAKGSDDSLKSGTQVAQPQHHDCQYITERNKRIDKAAIAADTHALKVCGQPNPDLPKLEWEKYVVRVAKVFNARFTAEMEQRLRVV